MTEERAREIADEISMAIDYTTNHREAIMPIILAACAEEREACADTVKSIVPYGGQRKLQEEALVVAVRAIEGMK